MIVAVNVEGGRVGAGLGRATTMAIAQIQNSQIMKWDEHEVRWDIAHDAMSQITAPDSQTQIGSEQPVHASHGSHHGEIARFFIEHDVQLVVTGHMGPPMANMLQRMGIDAVVGASGDAHYAALEAASMVMRSYGVEDAGRTGRHARPLRQA